MDKTKMSVENADEEASKLLEESTAEWWNPSGTQMVLHLLNPFRISFIIERLISIGVIKIQDRNKPDILKGLKILDVGSGAGFFSEAAARLGAEVTGLEPYEELMKIAKHHIKGQSLNVEYLSVHVKDFVIKNAEKFDVVCCKVIEHEPEKRSLLIAMTKCLKPNGSIFILTHNKTLMSWITTQIAELFKLIPKGSHIWNEYMKPFEIEEIFEEQNCRTSCIRGVWYTPILNKYSFIPYQGMQYSLHSVKDGISKKQD